MILPDMYFPVFCDYTILAPPVPPNLLNLSLPRRIMHASTDLCIIPEESKGFVSMMTIETKSHPAACMEALQLAGKIIMENGGETYRAEETITRMGSGFGLEEVESFAVPSGIFISYRGADGNPVTSVKRVRRLTRNLTRVNEANQVSRMVYAGEMDCDRALEQLRAIEKMPGSFKGRWALPAAFLCACGFAALFGAGWLSIAAAGVVAAVVQAMGMLMARFRSRGLAASVLGGLMTALLPALLALLIPSLQTDLVTAGAVMPLVPGLAMTNAVQDTMNGDMVSGISHGTQAILTACLVAGGALLASAVMRLLTGGAL